MGCQAWPGREHRYISRWRRTRPGGQGDCFLLLVTPHTTSEGSTQFPIPSEEEEENGGEKESCNGGGEGH